MHSVALVITTLRTVSNRYRRRPSPTLTGAACSDTRRGWRPATSNQYTASGIVCPMMAAVASAIVATFAAALVSSATAASSLMPGTIAFRCSDRSRNFGDNSFATTSAARTRPPPRPWAAW